MSQTKCPLCGASVELGDAHAGDMLQCPGCNCTFNAPARRTKRPPEGAPVGTPKKKAADSQPSGVAKFLNEHHESLLRWGKLAVLLVVGVVVALSLLRGIAKWGEKFEREADESALSFDLQTTVKLELAKMVRKARSKTKVLVTVESLEIDWGREADRTVPFTAELMADGDTRRRITFHGELDRVSGRWFASQSKPGTSGYATVAEDTEVAEGMVVTPQGVGFKGTVTASDSNTRAFAVIVLVVIGVAVVMLAKGMIKR